MFEELGMRGGTFIILCLIGYFIVKWAVKNGICEASKKMENISESNSLSTVLVNCIGKQCTIYTSSPISLELDGDFEKLWKLKCEVIDVDIHWIRICYEEKQKLREKAIRLNQIKSVDIL